MWASLTFLVLSHLSAANAVATTSPVAPTPVSEAARPEESPAASYLCVPSAEMDPKGTWEIGVYALQSPQVEWERTMVEGRFLPNPSDREYYDVQPTYDRGWYPPTSVTDASNQPLAGSFYDYYRMRAHRLPQEYTAGGLPYNEGPAYYMHVPRLTTFAPYIAWTANDRFQAVLRWTTFVSKSRDDYRLGEEPILQFPSLRLKWQVFRNSGWLPATAVGFDDTISARDRGEYERYLWVVGTWRIRSIAFSLGWANLNFDSIGSVFAGLHLRLSQSFSIAIDGVWATWQTAGTPETWSDYLTGSLGLQYHRKGWIIEAGCAESLARHSAGERFPIVRLAHDIHWKSIWGVMYHDPE